MCRGSFRERKGPPGPWWSELAGPAKPSWVLLGYSKLCVCAPGTLLCLRGRVHTWGLSCVCRGVCAAGDPPVTAGACAQLGTLLCLQGPVYSWGVCSIFSGVSFPRSSSLWAHPKPASQSELVPTSALPVASPLLAPSASTAESPLHTASPTLPAPAHGSVLASGSPLASFSRHHPFLGSRQSWDTLPGCRLPCRCSRCTLISSPHLLPSVHKARPEPLSPRCLDGALAPVSSQSSLCVCLGPGLSP